MKLSIRDKCGIAAVTLTLIFMGVTSLGAVALILDSLWTIAGSL